MAKQMPPTSIFKLELNELHTARKAHDYADAFIVRAVNENQARFLAAEQAGDEGHDSWLDEAQSTCRELGRGLKGADSEVLLRSYNAG